MARLSLFSVGLFALAVGVLVLAAWLAHRVAPKEIVGQLPLGPDDIPAVSLLVAVGAAAAAFFVGLAALHAAAAMRVLARDRRIPPPLSPEMRRVRRTVLAPLGSVGPLGWPRSRSFRPSKLPDRAAAKTPLRLTALVPAHDEALTIAATLESLWGQTRPPDRIVVVADNCTDDTAEIARAARRRGLHHRRNTDKKAGALNQALSGLFDHIDTRDVVMVMDADSVLVPEFLETAMERLEADPDLMAVGGVFYGERGSGLVGQLQRNEYTRYQRYISRRLGKVFVLTGTASLFRTYALKAVADSRGELLPRRPGRTCTTRWR